MKFCQHCGGQNEDNNGHCTHCGAALPAGYNDPNAQQNNAQNGPQQGGQQQNPGNSQGYGFSGGDNYNNGYNNGGYYNGGYNSNFNQPPPNNYQYNNYRPPVVDNGGCGWMFLGFIIPIVGLVLYLVWINERPNSARAAGKGALIAVISVVALYAFIFMIAMASSCSAAMSMITPNLLL